MAAGRKTGGRQKGTPNKATAELKAYAQRYDKEALDILIDIARNGTVEVARVVAADKVLDRGHGKAPQALTDADGENLTVPQLVTFLVTKAPGADTRK